MSRTFPSLVVLLCLVLAAPGEEVKVKEVVAEGAGTTEKEAEEDAVRNAVRQVVGAYVSAETLVKNEKLIEDKILSVSDGFVKAHKVVRSRKVGKLWRVTVRATVAQEKLVARLEQFKIGITRVDASVHERGRIADADVEKWTKEEARAKKTELLYDILLDYPRVMTARARRPNRFDYDEDKGVLTVEVQVSADLEAYSKWVKRLTARLDKINQAKSTAQFTAQPRDLSYTLPKTSETGFIYGARNPADAADWAKLQGPDLTKMRDSWSLWVATSVADRGARTRWAGYVLDANLGNALRAVRGELSVKVELVDADGAKVAGEEFSLKEAAAQPNWLGTVNFRSRVAAEFYTTITPLVQGTCSEMTNTHTNTLLLGPFQFSVADWRTEGYYIAQRTHPRKFMLMEKEWKKVKEIRCSVLFKPTKPGK